MIFQIEYLSYKNGFVAGYDKPEVFFWDIEIDDLIEIFKTKYVFRGIDGYKNVSFEPNEEKLEFYLSYTDSSEKWHYEITARKAKLITKEKFLRL